MADDGRTGSNPGAQARRLATDAQTWRMYAKLVAKVWADPEFAERLAASPADALREEGFNIPEDAEVEVVMGKPDQPLPLRYHLMIPAKPASLDSELPIEQLQAL